MTHIISYIYPIISIANSRQFWTTADPIWTLITNFILIDTNTQNNTTKHQRRHGQKKKKKNGKRQSRQKPKNDILRRGGGGERGTRQTMGFGLPLFGDPSVLHLGEWQPWGRSPRLGKNGP